MAKYNPLNSFVNGFMRKAGFTAANRTTEAIGRKILNPKSKLRKKIDKFELTGEFKSSYKKILTLIEVFYEEYCINSLPMVQIGTYFQSDVHIVTYKIKVLDKLATTEEEQNQSDFIKSHWDDVINDCKINLGING